MAAAASMVHIGQAWKFEGLKERRPERPRDPRLDQDSSTAAFRIKKEVGTQTSPGVRERPKLSPCSLTWQHSVASDYSLLGTR